MAYYRLYLIAHGHHIDAFHQLDAEDDAAAIALAEPWVETRAMELWSGTRVVRKWTGPGVS